ncbi:hypothetical protein KKB68_02580, partial [Patescibacteria group bacterium]|nr:hypothetical protein [Patescibacteria group bacterium]
MKFSLSKLFLLSGAIVLSFFFGFQTKASVFYDDFDSASFRNIYSGDECKLGTRAGGTGSVADKWNAYYQDTSCIDEADCLNCVIQDYCNSGVDPCCSKSCSNGGLDENWGHNEHGADANIEVLSEDSISKLKMFRGDITLENVCGADQIVGPYAHRFMLLESADRLLDSALDTFKLETKVKVSDLTGWGVGWELGSMVRGWYLNSEDDFIVTFSGIESGGRPVEWRAAANDSEWHTIEVIGRGLVREAWVGGNVRCASERDNSCVLSSDPGVSCNRCKVGEGNISSFSTSSETGYIWMGNRVNQYGG